MGIDLYSIKKEVEFCVQYILPPLLCLTSFSTLLRCPLNGGTMSPGLNQVHSMSRRKSVY